MGSENGPLMGKLFVVDKNGNKKEIATGEVTAVQCEPIDKPVDGLVELPGKGADEEYSCECALKIKTVTRKRFIKILMAHGIAKNGAKDIADYVHKKYGEYDPMKLLLL